MLHSMGLRAVARRCCASSALVGTAFAVSACASTGDLSTASLAPPPEPATTLGQRHSDHVSTSKLANITPAPGETADGSAPGGPTAGGSEQAALQKAHQLRLAGKKAKALKTLDEADNSETAPALVKQRGMLALELGQLAKAEKLLTRARDEFEPDWRVHSALGATLSARGNQQAAQLELSKALKLAPDHPSVLNNLALSYALDGNHDQAETLLRRASNDTKSKTKTKQNLALILGLNGNVKEAQKVSALVLPRDKADANAAYFASRKTKPVKLSKAASDRLQPRIQSAKAATTKNQ